MRTVMIILMQETFLLQRTETFNVYEIVSKLRKQRIAMVQTKVMLTDFFKVYNSQTVISNLLIMCLFRNNMHLFTKL
jgi:protein tyrosine phosphatase